MATLAQILEEALKHRNSGSLQVAEDLCRKVLEVDFRNVNALHLMALIVAQRGGHVLAEDYLRKAIHLKPDLAELHRNLGIILSEVNRKEEAEASIRTALCLNPNDAEAYSILGGIFLEQRQWDEAIANYLQGLRLNPNCTYIHNNIGVSLRHLNRQEEAKAAFQQAISLKPDYAEAHNNLGAVLEDQGELDQAVTFLQEAIRLKPNYAEAYGNLGNIYHKLGNLDLAKSLLQEAIRLKSDYAEAHLYLGAVFQLEGELDQALTAYRKSISLKPDFDLAHFNLGVVLLLMGHLKEGWDEYEWRLQLKKTKHRTLSQPHWNGTHLGGKTVLLHAEQGFGDTIQFVRYLPLVMERGGKIVFECQPELLQLMTEIPGVIELIKVGDALPHFDVHLPLMSLPRVFETTLSTIPARIPYLFADNVLVEYWRQELKSLNGFKLGIVWQGNPLFPRDQDRSIPLRHFEKLARSSRVNLISLQKEESGIEQLRTSAGRFNVLDLSDRLKTFSDTAAVMRNLDLVISSCTSVAHLAGALGVPIWTVLQFIPDWRWLLNRSDSPWYPTMRLFRQKKQGDWREVFDEITETLKASNFGMQTN